ncbi:hypothetical protein E7Y32_02795 [Arthrobacter sp. UKPF54-2]|uniref:hypothetical protein n=1 Tax=Arthrobacter sp. UKPF54-2 TaxID=2600159 RepID=UPI0011B12E29|nr:hypothetical protein [Arthrobacter sp. UKPF54-2]QDY89259.1 hypothetical protein E7Y32_02795 [Arthrobacter sp. UKPF54-2]
MKRALLPIALILGLFAGPGTAAAAPPIPEGTSTDTLDCPGFQVEVQSSGSYKFILQLHHFNVSKPYMLWTETGVASSITMTSLTSAPKSVTYSLNGSRKTAVQFEPFDYVYTATGRNLMVVQASYGTPGIFLSVGKVTWTQFGPVYPTGGMTGPGHITDICALLAP